MVAGLVLVAPVVLFMGYGLLRYGTPGPCSMLKKQAMEMVNLHDVDTFTRTVAEAGIENRLSTMSPFKCAKRVLTNTAENVEAGGADTRVFDAQAKSDLRNAMSAQEAYFADHGTYGSTPDVVSESDFTPSRDITIATTGSGDTYRATATHSASPNYFWVEVGTGSTIEGKVQEGKQ